MIRTTVFFDELNVASPTGLSLKESVGSQPYPEENKIIDYLESGYWIEIRGGIYYDLLSVEKKYAPSPSILTDGVWFWTECLKYYVKEYYVSLPEDFIKHLKSNNWKVPWIYKVPWIGEYKFKKIALSFYDKRWT